MNHIAIMKKEWGLLDKVLNGSKTVESRWYKSKIAPWNKANPKDAIYFKDSSKSVTVKAKITKIEQFEIQTNEQALKIMSTYALKDLGTNKLAKDIKNYIKDKKYAIFVHFNEVEEIEPFEIDKRGYGVQCAWMCVENINNVKISKKIEQ